MAWDKTGQLIAADPIETFRLVELEVTKPWIDRVKAKLAQANTKLVPIAGFGDSILEGYSAFPDIMNLGMLGKLRDALQAQYGDGGTGVITANKNQESYVGLYPTISLPITRTFGTWATASGGQSGFTLDTTGNNSRITISGVRGRRGFVGLVQKSTYTGNIEIRVDGVLRQTIAAGNATTRLFMGPEIDMGVGTHTVEIKNVSNSGMSFDYFYAYNDAGVVVDNWAVAGSSSGLINQLVHTGGATLGQWLMAHYYAGAGWWAGRSPAGITDPVWLLEHGHNDINQSVTEDTLRANLLQQLVWMPQYNPQSPTVPGFDALLIHMALSDNALTTGWGARHAYAKAIRSVADIQGLPVYSVQRRTRGVSRWITAMGYATGTEYTHPNPAGHAWMAQPLIDLLAA